jgi:hypothetical protein
LVLLLLARDDGLEVPDRVLRELARISLPGYPPECHPSSDRG